MHCRASSKCRCIVISVQLSLDYIKVLNLENNNCTSQHKCIKSSTIIDCSEGRVGESAKILSILYAIGIERQHHGDSYI